MQPGKMIADLLKKYKKANLAITIEREKNKEDKSFSNYVVTVKLINELNSFSWEAKAKTKNEAIIAAITKAELELSKMI